MFEAKKLLFLSKNCIDSSVIMSISKVLFCTDRVLWFFYDLSHFLRFSQSPAAFRYDIYIWTYACMRTILLFITITIYRYSDMLSATIAPSFDAYM